MHINGLGFASLFRDGLIFLQGAAEGGGYLSELADHLRELGRQKGLVAVGKSLGGAAVDLDDEAVGPRRDGGARHGGDELADPDAVGGVHKDGQMGEQL